ncbi:MAG: TonB-dependent receptor, partial [Bacteroidota bacterium]
NISAHERTAGVYGTVGFELYDQLFLNVSARQDWLSTLPEDDNTVFYPAADLSWQFSKMLKNSTFSSGRLRLGYGQVGRGPDPYLTRQVFFQPNAANTGWGEGWGPGLDVLAYGGGAALSTIAANPDIKPEIKTEMEAGIDLGFFKDRIGLRFTGYRNKTEDLIIQVTVPESSGFTH